MRDDVVLPTQDCIRRVAPRRPLAPEIGVSYFGLGIRRRFSSGETPQRPTSYNIPYLTSVCLISEDPAYNDYRDVLTRIQYP